MMTNRPLIPSGAFGPARELARPLNDALAGIFARLDALEVLGRLSVLPDIEFETRSGLVLPGTPPFPLIVASPNDFTPVGLVVLRLVNRSNPAGGGATPPFPYWDPLEADGKLSIQFITGLTSSTQYTLTLGAIRGN